jgi:hypothetical protein
MANGKIWRVSVQLKRYRFAHQHRNIDWCAQPCAAGCACGAWRRDWRNSIRASHLSASFSLLSISAAASAAKSRQIDAVRQEYVKNAWRDGGRLACACSFCGETAALRIALRAGLCAACSLSAAHFSHAACTHASMRKKTAARITSLCLCEEFA